MRDRVGEVRGELGDGGDLRASERAREGVVSVRYGTESDCERASERTHAEGGAHDDDEVDELAVREEVPIKLVRERFPAPLTSSGVMSPNRTARVRELRGPGKRTRKRQCRA